MANPSRNDSALLDSLIEENGMDKLEQYMNQIFTPAMIKISRVSPENVHEWINIQAYAKWLVENCQEHPCQARPRAQNDAPRQPVQEPPRRGNIAPPGNHASSSGPSTNRQRQCDNPVAGSSARRSEALKPADKRFANPCGRCSRLDLPCRPQKSASDVKACARCAKARTHCSLVTRLCGPGRMISVIEDLGVTGSGSRNRSSGPWLAQPSIRRIKINGKVIELDH